MIHKLSIFFLAAAALLSACAPLAQRDELSAHQWKRVTATLEQAASVDDLVTAALIRNTALRDPSGALTNLDRALELDPRQPDAAWLALSICAEIRNCSQAPRSARLIALDPGNSAANYPALREARATTDIAAEDIALAEMAGSKYFDVYWSRLITRSTGALAKPRGSAHRPLRELRLTTVEAVGWLAGAAIPPFSATSDTCKGDRLKRADVVEWCQRLASVLDNGDTYISQMIGRAIATRVWAPESVELTHFVQRRREYNYVQEMIRPYQDAVYLSVENTERWLNRFRANRSERDVYRAWLVDLGIPADPPADWESEATKP
jgi:hypothetical protein